MTGDEVFTAKNICREDASPERPGKHHPNLDESADTIRPAHPRLAENLKNEPSASADVFVNQVAL